MTYPHTYEARRTPKMRGRSVQPMWHTDSRMEGAGARHAIVQHHAAGRRTILSALVQGRSCGRLFEPEDCGVGDQALLSQLLRHNHEILWRNSPAGFPIANGGPTEAQQIGGSGRAP